MDSNGVIIITDVLPPAELTSLKALRRGQLVFVITGIASLFLYGLATLHGAFRPLRMEPFFPIFFALFVLHVVAVLVMLRVARWELTASTERRLLILLGIGAAAFNIALVPSLPTLSDDMYRYLWDGRVQAQGINPYRYASSDPHLEYLRDTDIWARMNRIDAHTIYPPFAQAIFASTWRLVGDSIVGFKFVFIAASLLGGWLLMHLLRALGESPLRVIIYLWSPLLIFEVAHSAHVDILYLPLVIGAMLLRARSDTLRVDWRVELGIGVLIGLATLTKLTPIFLAVPLWSLRTGDGGRRWRVMLPIAMVATVIVGYAVYYAPDVNLLGFLPTYGREFFNIGPLPRLLIDGMFAHLDVCRAIYRVFPSLNTPCWSIPNNYGVLILVAITSLCFWVWPARTPRQAIMRCIVPIGLYLLINHNLFSWYALWLLPLIALDLKLDRWRVVFKNPMLGWWLFTGLLGLSYVLFVNSDMPVWATLLEFVPLYLLLIVSGVYSVLSFTLKRQQSL